MSDQVPEPVPVFCKQDEQKEIESQSILIPLCDLYDDLIKLLSNEQVWKNIFLLTDAQNMISGYYHCIPYINGKNKTTDVMTAILNNGEITPFLKNEVRNYMIQLGMKYNEHEMLFNETASLRIDNYVDLCDALYKFISNKLVDPNFQTSVGNIFHIVAGKTRWMNNDEEVLKTKFKALMDLGCDLRALNKDGKTPFQVAIDNDSKIGEIYQDLLFDKIMIEKNNTNQTDPITIFDMPSAIKNPDVNLPSVAHEIKNDESQNNLLDVKPYVAICRDVAIIFLIGFMIRCHSSRY